MVVHAYNLSMLEAEAGVYGQPGLHRKFQSSLGYIVRPYLKNKQASKTNAKNKPNRTSIFFPKT
jgi:hypothetical protein